jgi:hypothetical protein
MDFCPDILHSKLNFLIAHHLAFIINWNRGEKGEIGTGLFVLIGDKRIIITARHIIDSTPDDDIYVNLGLENQKHVFKKIARWEDPDLDVAFIELEPFAADIIRNGIEPYNISSKICLKNDSLFDGLAICGYPRTYWKFDQNRVVATTYSIFLQHPLAFDLWPQRAKDEIDKTKYMLISLREEDLGQKLVDQNNENPDKLDPHGLSGAPVWFFDLSTIDDNSPIYILAGLCTGYLKYAKDILKATYINPLILAIENKYGFNLPIHE